MFPPNRSIWVGEHDVNDVLEIVQKEQLMSAGGRSAKVEARRAEAGNAKLLP